MIFLPVFLYSFIALALDSDFKDYNEFRKAFEYNRCDSPVCHWMITYIAANCGGDYISSCGNYPNFHPRLKEYYKCVCQFDDQFFVNFSYCTKVCPHVFKELTEEDKEPENVKHFHCEAAGTTNSSNSSSASFNPVKKDVSSDSSTLPKHSSSATASIETKKNVSQVLGVSLIYLLGIALL